MPFWHSIRRFVTTTLCHFGTSRGLALCHFGTAKKKKPPGVQRVHRAATWQIRNGGIRHEGHHKTAGRSRGRRTGSQTMNQRQRAFCEAYLKCGNAAEAARKAGYSARTARSIGQRLLTYVCINFPAGQCIARSRCLPDVARVCTGKTKRRPHNCNLHTIPARRVIRLPIHRPADHAPTPRGLGSGSCGWHSLLHPGFRAGKDHLPSCTPGKYQSPRHTQTCTCRRPGKHSFRQF